MIRRIAYAGSGVLLGGGRILYGKNKAIRWPSSFFMMILSFLTSREKTN